MDERKRQEVISAFARTIVRYRNTNEGEQGLINAIYSECAIQRKKHNLDWNDKDWRILIDIVKRMYESFYGSEAEEPDY